MVLGGLIQLARGLELYIYKTLFLADRFYVQGPTEARRAPGLGSRSGRFGGVGKEGASADFVGEMKDMMGLRPWRLHGRREIDSTPRSCCGLREKTPLDFRKPRIANITPDPVPSCLSRMIILK